MLAFLFARNFSQIAIGVSLFWFYLLVKKALEWNREREFRNPVKEKKPRVNLVSEFIKAKYNKYCPKIDWE
jgi:hypothetical protein